MVNETRPRDAETRAANGKLVLIPARNARIDVTDPEGWMACDGGVCPGGLEGLDELDSNTGVVLVISESGGPGTQLRYYCRYCSGPVGRLVYRPRAMAGNQQTSPVAGGIALVRKQSVAGQLMARRGRLAMVDEGQRLLLNKGREPAVSGLSHRARSVCTRAGIGR